jgi:hypothetical protein
MGDRRVVSGRLLGDDWAMDDEDKRLRWCLAPAKCPVVGKQKLEEN